MKRSRLYDVATAPLIVGRAASLPARIAVALMAAEDPLEAARAFFAASPVARTAVAVASPSLAEEIDRWVDGAPGVHPKTPLRALSYAIRMATRCTPFGLFAGVGLIDGDDGNGLPELDLAACRTHTRADMELLDKLVQDAIGGTSREAMRYVTNHCAFVSGDRLHVTNVALANQGVGGLGASEQRSVSLRNTKAVVFVRRYCEAGATYRDAVAALAREFDAPEDESRRLFEHLLAGGVLICDVHPSPLGNPVAHVVERMERAGSPQAQSLRSATSAASVFDASAAFSNLPERHACLREAFARAAGAPVDNLVQIDLRAQFRGGLPAQVLRDVTLVADLSARSGRVTRLDAYRRRFTERYEGTDRMVPLLELVDDELGLGLPEDPDVDAGEDEARQTALAHLLALAARTNVEELDLSKEHLDTVLPVRERGRAPRGIEIGFQVASQSAEALARGEYRVVTTMFSHRPVRSIARFAGMLGPEAVERAQGVARRTHASDETVAELSYAPVDARAYNVLVRPKIYDYAVTAGLADADPEHTISPSDLWVGLDDDAFFLWSEKLKRRIGVRETHAFVTTVAAPNLCRFLALVETDGERVPEFHLGAAEAAGYLPRLSYGRVVLRPRRWRWLRAALGGDAREVSRSLEGLRQAWTMPRYVYLCDGDNRLLIDLDSAVAGALLHSHAKGPDVKIEEALPSPDETWVRADDGTHAVEFIAQAVAVKPSSPPRQVGRDLLLVNERRRHGPMSQWTSLHLYVGEEAADGFIALRIAPLVAELAEGAIDQWFFVRYADSRHHLRLRLHAASPEDSRIVRERSLGVAEEWLRLQTLARYSLETYDPEYERYGGIEGTQRAERFFSIDSDACVAILSEGLGDSGARIEAAAASFDCFVQGSHRALAAALVAFASPNARKLEARDRESLQRISTSVLACGPPYALDDALDGDRVAARLRSFAHMHCNRLGLRTGAEERVFQLLRALAVRRRARVKV